MELRAGYKKTEVGVIPEDWQVKTIKGITIDMLQGVNTAIDIPEYVESGYPILKANNIIDGEVNFSTSDHISIKTYQSYSDRFKIKKDDFLFSNIGARLGTGSLMKSNIECSFAWNVMRIIPNQRIVKPEFLGCIMNSPALFKEIKKNESGSGMGFIPKNVLQTLTFPIPKNLEEQTAIATALSDADALISSLEKLIAKKRNIKQGAMQKLLQPKEGWEVKKLGSFGKAYGGLSGKSKADFADGKFPYIPFMNIMSNAIIDVGYFDYVNIGSNENQNKALKGDLFFNGSSETPEEVGMCSVLLEDIPNLYLNSFCFGFRLNKESEENGLYLSYYFRSNEGRKLFYSMAQGATRYNLSKSNFNKMEVSLPKPNEQIEIANIFFDMDAEITALETKLEKYKMLKLGMMQNLLTGKIRLI